MTVRRSARSGDAGVPTDVAWETVVGNAIAYVESCRGQGTLQLDDEVARSLQRVCERLNDPELYVAVVGEYSSGKSSFVNAVLQEELLATSDLVTTATAIEIHPGDARGMRVHLGGEAHWWSAEDDPASIAALAARIGSAGGAQTLLDVLHILTTNPDVARRVDRLQVDHPAKPFGDRVVMIDTPGVNSIDELHRRVAARVLAELADIAIVLIPSNAPVSQSLCQFLSQNAQRHLHRAIFIVTKMAHVDERHRDGLLGYVQRVLEDDLGIDHPLVLPASIGEALAHMRGEVSSSIWYEEFRDLRARVWTRVEDQRAATVAEGLIEVLDSVLDAASAEVLRASDALAVRVDQLERLRVADLPTFVTVHHERTVAELANEVRRARDSLWPAKRIVATMIGEMGAAKAPSAPTRGVESGPGAPAARVRASAGAAQRNQSLVGAWERTLHQWEDAATTSLETVGNAYLQAVGALRAAFSREYEKLEGIGVPPSARRLPPAAPPPTADAMAALHSAAQALALSDRLVDLRGVAGGVAGAAIGTAVLPGLGTIIGLLVGLGAAGRDGAARAAKQNARLREILMPAATSLSTELDSQLSLAAANAMRSYDDLIAMYVTQYTGAIAELRLRHERERGEVEAMRRRLRKVARNLQRHRDEIARARTELACVAIR